MSVLIKIPCLFCFLFYSCSIYATDLEYFLLEKSRYSDLYSLNLVKLNDENCAAVCRIDASLDLSRLSILMGDLNSAHTYLDYAQSKKVALRRY